LIGLSILCINLTAALVSAPSLVDSTSGLATISSQGAGSSFSYGIFIKMVNVDAISKTKPPYGYSFVISALNFYFCPSLNLAAE
jgi:hypothetical protein